MNTDADPVTGYEPNTTGGTEDLGGGYKPDNSTAAWNLRILRQNS